MPNAEKDGRKETISEPQKPLLLDLFCGAGGAAMGYARAGFEVTGIDLHPQPHYPFRFIQGDAQDFHSLVCWPSYDLIHASPPCQDYSKNMRHLAKAQPRLIEPMRELLRKTGSPWVIENVDGAPLATATDLFGHHGVELCGTSFGLRIQRHRLFEASHPLPPMSCRHQTPAMNPHNQRGRDLMYEEFGRGDPELHWRREMGVEWMSRYEAREAIPPVYTEWIGRAFLAILEMAA